jgi:protein-tyrosine phosphatase
MIDTHCHLLPELDDGTRSLDEAVALAAELAEAGIVTVVCTPHRSRRFPTDMEIARKRLTELRDALRVSGIDLALQLAAELSPAYALSLDPAALRESAMGHRYALVELEPATPASAVPALFAHLAAAGLLPIFAHPERSRAVARDAGTLIAARERGALVQVVATSLSGAWGRSVAQTALGLVTSGRADLLATDAHRPGHTSRHLGDVLERLLGRIGPDAVRQLTTDAPLAVLADAETSDS